MVSVFGTVRTNTGRPCRGIPVTNGEEIVSTDSNGKFKISVDPSSHSFIFVTRAGGFSRDRWFLPIADAGETAELEISPPERKSSPHRTVAIGHITDIHLDEGLFGIVTKRMLLRDLRELHTRCPELDLVVASGDMTDSGDIKSLRAFRSAIATSRIPVLPFFGAHDGNEEGYMNAPFPHTRNWERVLGPPYYSVEIGGWHVVAYPDEDWTFGQKHAAMKRRWLEADLAGARGRPVLLAQHSAPSDTWLEFLAEHGVKVVLFGHFHASKCYRQRGVLVYSTAPLVYGGYDSTPRGFRVMMLGRNAIRSRYVAFSKSRPQQQNKGARLKIAWQAKAPSCLCRSQPLVSGTHVYVPVSDEEYRGSAGILCLDVDTGRRKWFTKTEDSVRGTLATSGDLLAAVTQPGELYVCDCSSGSILWSRRLTGYPERWIHTGPAVAHGTVIAGTGSGGIEAFALETGEALWSWTHPNGARDGWTHYSSPVAVGERFLIVVARIGVSCLTAKDGTLCWHYDSHYEYMLAPVELAAGRVFVPDNDRFYAVDPGTGKHLWMRPTLAGEILSWAADDDLLVINTADGRFYGTSDCRLERVKSGVAQFRNPTTGAPLFEVSYGEELASMVSYRRDSAHALAAPILSQYGVYLAGLDGRISVVDRGRGDVVSTMNVDEPIVSWTQIDEHSLVASTYPGSVLRIDDAAV